MNTILIFLLLAPLFGGGGEFYSRAYAVAEHGLRARRGAARAR